MDELRDLYQELIIGHAKRPHNFRVLEHPSQESAGFNPLCGDKLHLYLAVEGDQIKDATFQGSGCAISTASASLMTDTIKGKTVAEAQALFARFHEVVTSATDAPVPDLGKLSVFAGVREFPARVKCASLAWHTLKAALERKANPVSTEDLE